MITAVIETINATQASEYLIHNTGNRRINKGHLARLVGKQKRGEWITNGDTIRIDTTGAVRDGQHRLAMVEKTKIPIEAIVVRGIDPKAFSTMDVGKKRSLSDVLGIDKELHPIQLSEAARLVWQYLSHNLKGEIGTHEEIRAWIIKHPDIRQSIEFYQQFDTPTSVPQYRAAALAAHYLFSKADKKGADDFISRYITGFNLTQDDPIHGLRDYVLKVQNAARPANTRQVLRLLITAWNAYQRHKPVKRFNVAKRAQNQSATIDGLPEKLFFVRPNQLRLLDLIQEEEPEEDEQET
jgi:hypothetical protein